MILTVVIGSNSGDREANIKKALISIEETARLCSRSRIYETPDCFGFGLKYLNIVIQIETGSLSLDVFQKKMKELERQCGRNEESRKRGEVCIDIDIVLVDTEILREADYKAAYFQKGYKELSCLNFNKN